MEITRSIEPSRKNVEDIIKWSKNKETSKYITKLGYSSRVEELQSKEIVWWCKIVRNLESPPKSRVFLCLAWDTGQKRNLNGPGSLTGASCVNVVRKQWITYLSIVLYLRLSRRNYYNYLLNKQMWLVKFGWLFFSNGYMINMKKISRFSLSLWISKNSFIFQGTKLNIAQAAHKI